METAKAELGSLCLVSTTADLELHLDSDAQFVANDVDFTVGELVSKAMDHQAADKPWVRRGDVFKLIVSLLLDETGVEPHSTTQAFSERLYKSEVLHPWTVSSGCADLREMWCQLCLEPISMTLSGNRHVTIQLSHSTHSVPLSARQKQYHKLSDELSCSDVRPHAHVPILELNSVHLTMRIWKKHETKRRQSNHVDTNHENAVEFSRSESTGECLHIRLPKDLLAARYASMHEIDSRMLQPACDMATDCSCSVPQPLKRSSWTSEIDKREGPEFQHDILAILDAGVRLAITSKPQRLLTGVRLDESDSYIPLAEVAPSVWSPGFLRAMSSRSLLLPTISHALSQVGIGNAKGERLKSKLAEVVRRTGFSSASGIDMSSASAQRQFQDTQLSIGSRLWQLAQSTIFNRRATYQLKGLFPYSEMSSDDGYGLVHDLHYTIGANDSEGGADCDSSYVDIDHAGYDSEDDLLSISGVFESSPSRIENKRESEVSGKIISCNNLVAEEHSSTDEDMLCT